MNQYRLLNFKFLHIFVIFIALNALVFAQKINANSLASSYNVEITVNDYAENTRNKAFVDGYKQLIQQQTGKPINLQDIEIKNRLKNISDWVQSYNYTQHNDKNGKIVLFINIKFAQSSIPDSVSDNSQQKNNTNNIEANLNNPNSNNVDSSNASINNVMNNTVEKTIDNSTSTTTSTNIVAIPIPEKQVNSNVNSNSANLQTENQSTKQAENLTTNNKQISSITTPTTTQPAQTPTDVLLWLVILGDVPEKNIFLDSSSKNTVVNNIKNQTQQLNINVILPTMDLEDLTKITTDDVCNFDRNTIQSASSRYATKNILVACIKDTKPSSHSEWLLLSSDQTYKFTFDANDTTNILNQGFNKTHDILFNVTSNANQINLNTTNNTTNNLQQDPQNIVINNDSTATSNNNIISNNIANSTNSNSTTATTIIEPTQSNSFTQSSQEKLTADQVIIYINNVADIEQYSLAIKYLKTFPEVQQVELQNIQGSTIKLKVNIHNGKYGLVQVLEKQEKLKLNNSEIPNDRNAMNYDWQKELPITASTTLNTTNQNN